MSNRNYTSRRMAIVNALVVKLKLINGNFPFRSNLYNNVEPKLLFWDEVQDFPAVHVSAGSETRDYQGGGYKDRFMTVPFVFTFKKKMQIWHLKNYLKMLKLY